MGKEWLVLIYQFPKGSGSQRVKIWRRLQGIGAVAIKNSAYVLPRNEQALEDFEWMLAELQQAGAEAALLATEFLSGMDGQEVQGLFNAARTADYAQVLEKIDALGPLPDPDSVDSELLESARQALLQLRRRFGEIEAIDFFGAEQHDATQAALWSLERQLAARQPTGREGDGKMDERLPANLRKRVWVTRRNVRVDRIASAWLIRRWIDPEARFKFVDAEGYSPRKGEVRFDMFDAEFTHRGDRCTFEVLSRLAAPDDAALGSVAEIVHDIDLKDEKFGRPETQGVASLLAGLVAGHDDDPGRLERGGRMFEDLYSYFASAGT